MGRVVDPQQKCLGDVGKGLGFYKIEVWIWIIGRDLWFDYGFLLILEFRNWRGGGKCGFTSRDIVNYIGVL